MTKITPRSEASGHFVEDTFRDYGRTNYGRTGSSPAEHERGVMVRAWEQLRAAGFTPESAKLSDRLPRRIRDRFAPLVAAGETSKLPTTYEAAMRVLVTDQDQNGTFDLNIDRLLESGIVAHDPSAMSMVQFKRHVEVALTGRLQEIQPETLEDQLGEDGTVRPGVIDDDGRRLLHEARIVRFTPSSERGISDFIKNIKPRMRHNAGVVAGDALNRAQEWLAEGRRDAAGLLLVRTASELIRAGKAQQAGRILEALRGGDFASAHLNEMGFAQLPLADASEEPSRIGKMGPGGRVRYTFDPDPHLTYGSLAAGHLQRQIDFRSEMSGVLGRSANPYDLGQVREYLQSSSDNGASTGELASYLREYAEAFYVHSGEGANYLGWSDVDSRPAAAQEIMDSTLETHTGRRVIDCEGFTYLMHNLATSISTPSGDPRFSGYFASIEPHITLLLTDRLGGQIYVDNARVVERDFESDAEAVVAIVDHLLTGELPVGQSRTRSVRISDLPADSRPFDDNGDPLEGTFVGTVLNREAGAKYRYAAVNEDFRRAFIEYFDTYPERRGTYGVATPGAHDANMQLFLDAHPEFYFGG